ncbi:MAG TPA: TylF/MycF/NovP-related O-methyltransferase, partial [Pyrinomonadaceae bacterium]|nr:TylF/MycF/NovP-related O-methyltransferase [Pyrinomonadaceae bacterium]
MSLITRAVNRLIHPLGYQITVSSVGREAAAPARPVFPKDFSEDEVETCEAVRPYTMTSRERVASLVRAVKYVVAGGVRGDIVECGVWRGGSMMAVARTLLALGETGRDLYLFD